MHSPKPIDHFFRDGLNDLETPAPITAWYAVEGTLNRKQSAVVYRRYAAAAAIALALGWFYWPATPIRTNLPLAQKAIQKPIPIAAPVPSSEEVAASPSDAPMPTTATDPLPLTAEVVTVRSGTAKPVPVPAIRKSKSVVKAKSSLVASENPVSTPITSPSPIDTGLALAFSEEPSPLLIPENNAPTLPLIHTTALPAIVPSNKKIYDISFRGALDLLSTELQEMDKPLFSINQTATHRYYLINLGFVKIRRSATI